jgi:hypothetical protein
MTVVLNQLMFYALGTGLTTSLFALASGLTWIALPKTYISPAIFYVGTKMHVNSLLITLNARRVMQQHLFEAPLSTIGLPGSSTLPPSGIRVDQSTTRRTDRTTSSGPLTFKPMGTTLTTDDITDDIEMHKSSDRL